MKPETGYGSMRFLYAGWAVLETMLFGGIVNGWGALVFVLKEDGIYRDLCSVDTAAENSTVAVGSPCSEQDAILNLWFTIAAALRNIFGIVIGLHVFTFGTRSARLTGWFAFGVGALMMAFTDNSIPWLILPSLLTLSYGGVTLLLTNVQVSGVFPRAAGVVVTLVSGAFDFSATTQLIVKILNEVGVSRRYSYIGIAVLHGALVLVSTLLFIPKIVPAAGDDDSSDHQETPRAEHFERRMSLYDWRDKRNSSASVCGPGHEHLVLAENTNKGLQIESKDMTSEWLETARSISEDLPESGVSGSFRQFTSGMKQNSTNETKAANPENKMEDRQKPSDVTHLVPQPETGTEQTAQGMHVSIIDVRQDHKESSGSDNQTEDQPIRKDMGDATSSTCDESHQDERQEITLESSRSEETEGGDDMFPTLKSCLTSSVFVLHVFWMSMNVLHLVAFFGILNSRLTAIFNGDKELVSFYTNVQAYCLLFIILICWVSGAVYDWQTLVLKNRTDEFQRRVLPGALPLAMTSALGVAVSVLNIMVNSVVVLYAKFILFVFYNAFIFGVCLSFLLRVFPTRYFGILNGVLSIVQGSFCFLQYGVFRWHDAYPDGPLHANLFMLGLVAASFIHPAYLVIRGFCRQGPACKD